MISTSPRVGPSSAAGWDRPTGRARVPPDQLLRHPAAPEKGAASCARVGRPFVAADPGAGHAASRGRVRLVPWFRSPTVVRGIPDAAESGAAPPSGKPAGARRGNRPAGGPKGGAALDLAAGGTGGTGAAQVAAGGLVCSRGTGKGEARPKRGTRPQRAPSRRNDQDEPRPPGRGRGSGWPGARG